MGRNKPKHRPHVKTRPWRRCHWRWYWKLDRVFAYLQMEAELGRRSAEWRDRFRSRVKDQERQYYRQLKGVN